jgi:hypothetical protein
MMGSAVSSRVRRHRDALRNAGLRPIQLWVPDTRQPSFAEECHRQSTLLAQDSQEQEFLAWIADASDTAGWQ